MPRPRKQPIKAGDELARGARAAPHDLGGRYIGKVTIGGLGDPVPAPAHPAWEYRTVQSSDGRSPWFDVIAGLDATPCELDNIGALGWELVTIYSTGDGHYAPVYYAVFKRQTQDTNA